MGIWLILFHEGMLELLFPVATKLFPQLALLSIQAALPLFNSIVPKFQLLAESTIPVVRILHVLLKTLHSLFVGLWCRFLQAKSIEDACLLQKLLQQLVLHIAGLKSPQFFSPFSFDQAQDFLIWVLVHYSRATAFLGLTFSCMGTCDCWRFNRHIHSILLSPGLADFLQQFLDLLIGFPDLAVNLQNLLCFLGLRSQPGFFRSLGFQVC
mmetsp:Transcript_62722/g.102929  ORF Transcript_62722/g.102929 Transcript_62722/m.102929 type:complete len:210 (-) Transcript_62722:35-664(-)